MTLPTLCPFIARCVMAAVAVGDTWSACQLLRYAVQDMVAQQLMHGVATLFYELQPAALPPIVGLVFLEATAPLQARLPMRTAWVREWQSVWEAAVARGYDRESAA